MAAMRSTSILALVGALAGLAAGAAHAQAQVFRCTAADGKVTYTNEGCDRSQSSTTVDARPNLVDSTELREAAAADRAAAAAAAAARSRAPVVIAAPQAPDKTNTPECRSAQRNLEVAASSTTRQSIYAEQVAVSTACGLPLPAAPTVAPVHVTVHPSATRPVWQPYGAGVVPPTQSLNPYPNSPSPTSKNPWPAPNPSPRFP
jgi:hypothetical protein